jgi:hypothetical protein
MGLHKILCFGILFLVFVRQGSFAQCGQTTQASTLSTAPNGSPTPTIANPNSEDRTVLLQLEMTDRGSVRDVEVFGNPGKLRAAAITAAIKFANERTYDRFTWPFISVVVIFPQNEHGAPQVGQGVVGGVPACVHVTALMYTPPLAPPSWLFDIQPVIPLLAGSDTEKKVK